MSGSVTDNDASGTDWEKWIPQIDSTDDKYHFTWKPPWKNFRIKVCSNNEIFDNTSGFLIPLKVQFLITHHVSTVHKIIRNLESAIVESINSTEELLEIKVKSLGNEDIFTEIERALARETDDIVMKPIQRLKFTSSLVEELFKKELKEQCIDLMRDETNIFIVGFDHMKSLIAKHIDEINRLTATKVVKLGDKWKIEAVKCFGITETLSKTFVDVVVRLQEENSSVYLKGRDVTITKAEKEVHKLLSDLFNEKLLFDPLILKLLNSNKTSEFFNEVLQKEHVSVVWTVDSTHLYFFSKTKIDTDAVKAIVYENFLTAGFSKLPQHRKQFCISNTFIEITKKQHNKLLFLETTKSGVNIAGTKNLIFYLLHQEKLFYNDDGNTKEIQVDTLSFEVASIKDEKMKIDREKNALEVKLDEETRKRKNANDQYQLLERKYKEVEEKLKRITLEKELLQKEGRSKEVNLFTQLEELTKINDKQEHLICSHNEDLFKGKTSRASSDTKSRLIPGQFLQQCPIQPSGSQQLQFPKPDSRTPIVNILPNEFLEDEETRICVRYILETKFDAVKKNLEKENIYVYNVPAENGEINYFAKRGCVFGEFESKIYGSLLGFTFGCKSIKAQYPEPYYSTYSSSEIKFYRAENNDGIWIVGTDQIVTKICLEIEQKMSQTTIDTRQKDSKTDLSRSWVKLTTTKILLSQEEQSLIYLHRMFDREILKNEHITLKKEPQYGISIHLHFVEASRKIQFESDIRQLIEKRKSELFSSEFLFNSEEFEFLCREPVYRYVNKELNYNLSNIRCAWYICNSKKSVKIYSKSEVNLLCSCETFKRVIKTESFPALPEKYFSSLKTKHKISNLLSVCEQKLDIRLDPSGTMLHCTYTFDKQFQFSKDIKKILPITKAVEIFDYKNREFCKHYFTVIHHTIENAYAVSFTEKENQGGRYGWIVKGDPEDVQAAVKELCYLVKNVCTKVKTYQTDDRRKTIQEHVEHLTKNISCSVNTEEIKTPWKSADLDLRREMLCYEWKFPSSNFIQIINAEDGRLLWKESVVFHIQVKDESSLGDCFYHQESYGVILYIPAWKSDGKEKHTVFSILDTFYKKKPSEKPKSDMPLVLFLNELTKQGWPCQKFLKEFLMAWSRNCVSSPLYILEPNRETFERASKVVHKVAEQTSRPPRIKITVKTGEMAKMKRDAIVNSANENLTLINGVVSKSILLAAGQNIQDECTEIMGQRRHTQLNSKEVVVSRGYNLKCKFVFHGSLASWGNQTLAEFVYRCLREADLRELSSISFPSLGTGKNLYPPDVVAAIMFQIVHKYDIERNLHNLKEVDFVIYEKDCKVLKAFKTAEDRFKKGIVKDEKWLKCPNPYTVKVTVTAESESTVSKTFDMIEKNLKTNTKIGVLNPDEPYSQTIRGTDIETKTYHSESLTEEEKAEYTDLKQWSGLL
ncbi:uncharacterized protein [Mytilus edulis]|uniref:uncharacterized protein n=1 Tax=Mytilus edulis TaxID=6550 RepID=UPI0039EF6037